MRRHLEALLSTLFPGDARAANGQLSGLFPDLSASLPGLDTPPGRFNRDFLNAIEARDWLEDLRLKLHQARPSRREEIDEVLLRALAALAFKRDGVSTPANLADCELRAVVHAHARPGSRLQAWLDQYSPNFTPHLPPVLYLKRHGEWLTQASLRRVGQADVDLALACAPGSFGLHLPDASSWARAIGKLVRRLPLPDTSTLVIVLEAAPEDHDPALGDCTFPGAVFPLAGRFQAVAWWPCVEWPAEGRSHDDPLPAPGGTVAHWRKVPKIHQQQTATLGVWAHAGVWSPSCDCAVLGRHDRRYFAVCGRSPPKTPLSLTQLFIYARGHLLVWTDRRYHLSSGSHLQ